MEVIVLPSVLPGKLDLEAVDGLDLVEQNEVLGITTVPDALVEKVSQVLDASQVASLNPSSLGMSFCVDKDATVLLVTVR